MKRLPEVSLDLIVFRIDGSSPKGTGVFITPDCSWNCRGDSSVPAEYKWGAGHLGCVFVVVIRKTNCVGRESQQ